MRTAALSACLFLALASFASLSGCRSAPEPEAEVVRLDSAQAVQLARAIEEEVSVQPAEGLQLSLWAPEQLVEDPIALDVDPKGRVYVTGSSRSGSMLDIRNHPDWTTDVLTHRTVEDLRSFVRSELAPDSSDQNEWIPDLNEDGSHDWRDLTVNEERLYRIEDSTEDGLADLSRIMTSGFNTEVTDVAGGLMVHGEDIYLGAAPDLWRLRDEAGDGLIDARESISHGYGVHFGFNGHGMSGVTLGPDGRIYWSVGDFGLNVDGPGGQQWAYPFQGAILRSEPDGSGFEVYAAGLRNPHEFAFDRYGNLISVDNDGDHPGETERLVYIVEGSDSGWRANWQYGKYTDPKNNSYKVWMDEEMYKPRFEGQAAHITPPLASYHSGPTGMLYNPGTALSDELRGHFLVSEYTGSPATSKIHAFRLEEEGARFRLAEEQVLLSGILATGMEFGPEGALYVADWIEGWTSKGRGRIWKLDAPEAASSPQRTETQSLLTASFDERTAEELSRLLRHADRRVRMRAQLELADRSASETLLAAARQQDDQVARLHGIWGIGQLARQDLEQAAPLTALLQDADAEIRAQAAEVLGDVRYGAAGDALVPLLQDASSRVRFFAAEALGRIAHRPATQPLIDMLEANDDEDAFLRHAGSLALARIGEAQPVVALADHPSRAVRIAAVVTLRRMRHPGVARFLEDDDAYIVTEAARAINDDGSIEAALPDLAQVLEEQRFTGEALLRRAINANLRVGTAEAAERTASFAADSRASEPMRREAIAALGVWPKPSVLDRVDGVYHGPVERDTAIARSAAAPVAAQLLADASTPIREEMATAAGRLDLDSAAPDLMERVRSDQSADVRAAALSALHDMRAEQAEVAVQTALEDRETAVRTTALDLVASLNRPDSTTAELLVSVLDQGSVEEQQRVLQMFETMDHPVVHEALGERMDQLTAGNLAPEIQLDLLEAVRASDTDALQQRLAQYQSAKPAGDSLVTYREALHGGDARRGRQVFFENAAGQCTRCHALGIEGETVGPTLGEIGATLTREQLLEALVDPSARIAPGFGTVSLTLEDGQTVTGQLVAEDDAHATVRAGGAEQRIAKSNIAERTDAPSAMPPMGQLLTKREIRDLVAFLHSRD